jgi:hypothetical protein
MQSLEAGMQTLGKLVENAAAIEIISYHEDGQDETQLMFVGATPEAILDAQRRHMLQDVSTLLARHFRQEAVDEVLKLVSDLFHREQRGVVQAAPVGEDEHASLQMPDMPGRHRLH